MVTKRLGGKNRMYNSGLKIKSLILVFLLMLVLGGCSSTKTGKAVSQKTNHTVSANKKSHFRKYDWVKVTSPNSDQTIQITNRKSIDYIANTFGDIGNISHFRVGNFKKHPRTAYHYTLYEAKAKHTINMYVFRNSKDVEINRVPEFKKIRYRLSEKQHTVLMSPRKLANGNF